MRRIAGFLIPVLLLVGAIAMLPAAVQGQIFVTNTPQPTPLRLVTNTPAGPTNTFTPSPSATASATPTSTPTFTLTPTSTSTNTATPTATFTPSNTPSPTPTPNGPISYPEGVNPMTGLPYPNQEAIDRRTLIVKISNFPPIVRPQTGVNAADLVYEVEAEGGVTRFAAFYRNEMPESVGPVRSARLLDIELRTMYNALLAYSGTSEPIQQIILNSEYVFQMFSPLKGDNCDNAGFCRDTELRAQGVPLEHTMFLDMSVLYDLATRRNVNVGFPARGFAFSENPDPNGFPANDVYVDWFGQADARWQYDPETERYYRWSDGVPHMDAADDTQIFADNLIVLEVEHRERPDLFPPDSNYQSLDIVLRSDEEGEVAQGRAYVIRNGVYYQGFWRRMNDQPGSALQLVYGDNTPMMLQPGRSWVSVVRGLGNNVTISEDYADMAATSTAVALTATSTPDPSAINTDE